MPGSRRDADERILNGLRGNGAIALVGTARSVAASKAIAQVAGTEDEVYRQAYCEAWPEGRQWAQWRNLVYWRAEPRRARYSDYDRGRLIVEFHWNRE